MLQQPAANPSILQFPETLFQSSKVCDCDVAWSPHKAPLAWWHRDVMVGRGSSAHLSAALQLNQVSLSSRVQAVEMNECFQRLTDYHRVQLDHQGASPLHTPFSCCFFCFLWSCHTDFEEYFLRLYRQPSKMQRPPFQKKTIAASSSSQIALWLEGPLKWHYMCCYAMWCSYNCTCAWEQKQHLISSDSINFLTPCCL